MHSRTAYWQDQAHLFTLARSLHSLGLRNQGIRSSGWLRSLCVCATPTPNVTINTQSRDLSLQAD